MVTHVYPASNNQQAIDLNISNANQFFTILQGGIDDFIPTYEGNGEIPSVAKALNEAAAYKVPVAWQTTGEETDLLQPREYNGDIYVPLTVPAPFSGAPSNSFWRLYSEKSAQILIDNLTFTGDGVTTDFSIPSMVVDDPAAYLVSVDGVDQRPTIDYTVNVGTDTLSFTEAPPATEADNISVTVLGALKGALAEGIYETVADGLDETVDGGFFHVVNTSDPEVFVDLYKNNAGSALLIDTYPNSVSYNNLANAVVYEADLADNSSGNGTDLIAHTGTSDTVTEALDKRTIFVGSVAELEAATSAPADGARYDVIGYYAGSDVGGGPFYWDAASTESANGVTIFKATSITTGRFKRIVESGLLTAEMGGAVGDNVANDWPAALAAFNVAKSGNKKLIFDGSKSYYLGSFPSSGKEVKFNIDVDNFMLETNGCTFRVDVSLDASHAATDDQVVVQVNDANNTTIGDYTVIADQIQRTPSRIGVIPLNIRNTSSNSYGLTTGKIFCEKAMAGCQVASDDPALYRHEGLKIAYLKNVGGYYGLNAANNGDDCEVTVRCEDCVRSYFVYGVDNHRGIVSSKDHAFFSDVVISRISRNTSNIDILYEADNDTSSDESVALSFVTDDTDAVIENVSIKLKVDKSNPANPTVAFRAFDGSSTPLTTTTNEWREISITGSTNSNSSERLRLESGMTGEARSTVAINKELFGRTQDTKGFIFSVSGESQVATANSATDLELDFKIRDVAVGAPIMARIDLVAFDNASGSSAEYFARDIWVLFAMPSDGSISVTAVDTVDSFSGGSLAPSLTVPAQPAGTYSLKVKVNNYTGSNRFIKGIMKTFSYKED